MNDNERNHAFNAALLLELKKRAALISTSRTSVLELLAQARDAIILMLSKQPSDYAQWYLPQILNQVNTILTGMTGQSVPMLSGQLEQAASLGMSQLDNILRPAGVSLLGVSPVIDTTMLSNIKQFHTGRIKDISTRTAAAIESELAQVLIGAQSPHQAMQAIRKTLNGYAKERAKTIVLTSLSSVYDKSAQDRYAQASAYLPGLQKRWQKSGKRHPRLTHVAAHNQTQPVDSPFKIGSIKMMHPHDPKAPAAEIINCGCFVVPHMDSWDVKQPAQKLNSAA